MKMAEKSNIRDINQIISYLNNTFKRVTEKYDRPNWNYKTGANNLYILQTEFAYLIHEIMIGVPCMVQRNIALCNEFIDEIVQHNNNVA